MKHQLLLTVLSLIIATTTTHAQTTTPLPVKTVTMSVQNMPVDEVLKTITKQTGIDVTDGRKGGPDVTLTLTLQKVPFWQALETVAQKANGRVSLQGSSIALVNGRSHPKPWQASVLRGTIDRVHLTTDFATDFRTCRVFANFAWQPGFQPFFVELKKYQATFATFDSKETISATGEGRSRLAAFGLNALEIDMLFPAPPRSFSTIKHLTGEVTVVGPRRMKTVVFKNLNKEQKLTVAKGVTVQLHYVEKLDPNLWEAKIELRYPESGPHFETHQDWLANNAIWLQNIKNKNIKIQPGPRSIQTDVRKSHRAVVLYRFGEGTKARKLGRLTDWHLHYRTPEQIVEVTLPFTFNDIPLP